MNSKIKTILYDSPLFRANKDIIARGTKASNNYKNYKIKYFTKNKSELKAYVEYGKPIKKEWEPTSKLLLINIQDLATRKELEKYISKASLDIAFPIIGSKVSRVSTEASRNHDDIVLHGICSLGEYDGYCMESIKNEHGNSKFHSEIGLCKKAFDKLKLKNYERNKNQGVKGPKKLRYTRNNNNNNSNNNSNNNNRSRRFTRRLNMNNESPFMSKLSYNG
jgi:hypothetical protein